MFLFVFPIFIARFVFFRFVLSDLYLSICNSQFVFCLLVISRCVLPEVCCPMCISLLYFPACISDFYFPTYIFCFVFTELYFPMCTSRCVLFRLVFPICYFPICITRIVFSQLYPPELNLCDLHFPSYVFRCVFCVERFRFVTHLHVLSFLSFSV